MTSEINRSTSSARAGNQREIGGRIPSVGDRRRGSRLVPGSDDVRPPTTAASGDPSPPPQDCVRVRFDAFELDETNARLLRNSLPLSVAPTPFALLCALARQPGSLLSKGALLDAVWGHRFVSEAVLKTAISDLRTVLQDDARRPRFIETVSRRGYRFIGATATTCSTGAKERAAALPTRAVVGRSRELARLRAAWDLACTGKRTFVWVAGDAGIGKTTLIDGFVESLGDVASARGQCVEQYAAGEPYLPILDALADLCRRDGQCLVTAARRGARMAASAAVARLPGAT